MISPCTDPASIGTWLLLRIYRFLLNVLYNMANYLSFAFVSFLLSCSLCSSKFFLLLQWVDYEAGLLMLTNLPTFIDDSFCCPYSFFTLLVVELLLHWSLIYDSVNSGRGLYIYGVIVFYLLIS